MEVSATDLARVPAENVRVPAADFGAMWVAAERYHDDRVRRRVGDWYGAGVVVTCRWLAVATVRPLSGPWRPARSPVTGRQNRAYPELIEAEWQAAHVLAQRRPVPGWLVNQPGWLDGISVTLDWAWGGSGRVPIEVGRESAAG